MQTNFPHGKVADARMPSKDVRPVKNVTSCSFRLAKGIRTSTHCSRLPKREEIAMRDKRELLIRQSIYLFALISNSICSGRP